MRTIALITATGRELFTEPTPLLARAAELGTPVYDRPTSWGAGVVRDGAGQEVARWSVLPRPHELLVTDLCAVAAEHGWTVTNRDGARALRLHRDREALNATTDASSGTVATVSGQIATGQVSITSVRDLTTAATILPVLTAAPAQDRPRTSGYDLLVAGGEHVEHYETASNYSRHALTPGRYPIELVSADHQPVHTTAAARYAIAHIPSIITEDYWCNRLLGHVQAHHDNPQRPSAVHWSTYAYQLPDGPHPLRCDPFDGHAQIVPTQP